MAGVKQLRPHQARYTDASLTLSAGEHQMWTAKQVRYRARVNDPLRGCMTVARFDLAGTNAEQGFSKKGGIAHSK